MIKNKIEVFQWVFRTILINLIKKETLSTYLVNKLLSSLSLAKPACSKRRLSKSVYQRKNLGNCHQA